MLFLGLALDVSNLLAILRTDPDSSRTLIGASGTPGADDELVVVGEDLDSPAAEVATPGAATADLPPPKVM